MNTIKRIDPRRPYAITAAGLRRITLGAVGTADETVEGHTLHAAHGSAARPRRTTQTPQRTILVAAHSDRGSLDDHARQTLAAAALIAAAHTQVILLVFGEMKDDAATLGADKLIELPAFDRRVFAPESELQAFAACVAQIAPAHILLPDNATGDGDLGRRARRGDRRETCQRLRPRQKVACHTRVAGGRAIGTGRGRPALAVRGRWGAD